MDMKKCDRCNGSSSLNVAPGFFRDLDSDSSYGIPVCGDCGGLGMQYGGEEFKSRTKEIMKLRFEYCPIHEDPPPAIVRFQKLSALREKIIALSKDYEPAKKSFAASVLKGSLEKLISALKYEADELVAIIADSSPKRDDEAACQIALIAAFSGEIEKACSLFDKLLLKFPDSSIVHHDYAGILTMFTGDYARTIPMLMKSLDLEPCRLVHFENVKQILIKQKMFSELKEVLRKSLNCPEANEEYRKRANKEISGLFGFFTFPDGDQRYKNLAKRTPSSVSDDFRIINNDGIENLQPELIGEVIDLAKKYGELDVKDKMYRLSLYHPREIHLSVSSVMTNNSLLVIGEGAVANEGSHVVEYDKGSEKYYAIWDNRVEIDDLLLMIYLFDEDANKKGWVGKNGERLRKVERISFSEKLYTVDDVFKKQGSCQPVFSDGPSAQELLRQYDHPEKLAIIKDDFGMESICHIRDVEYMEKRRLIAMEVLKKHNIGLNDIGTLSLEQIIKLREEIERKSE